MTNNTPDYEDNLYFACNKTQANDLACNEILLTEKWKKGELPEGWYYVKALGFNKEKVISLDFWGGLTWECDNDVIEVIAPVPSYDEWKASEKYNKYLEEKIKIYERKDKQATETSIAYNELANENAILKELLKDARNVLKMVDTYSGNYDSINGFLIVERINQVLGEDK